METRSTSSVEGKTKKCPYCAEEIEADAVLCSYCGKKLANIKKQSKNTIGLIAIPFVIILVLAVLWLYVEIGHFGGLSEMLTITTLDTRVTKNTDDIQSLAYDLSSVARIAENANLYAHSHEYSDARLKANILPIENPLTKILSVHGITFTWRKDTNIELPEGTEIGVIAQELKAVYPELVTVDENGLMRVDYPKITPILIEAIREQQTQIADLQKQITSLEEHIKSVEDAGH